MPRDELYGQCPTCGNAIPRCTCRPERESDMTTRAQHEWQCTCVGCGGQRYAISTRNEVYDRKLMMVVAYGRPDGQGIDDLRRALTTLEVKPRRCCMLDPGHDGPCDMGSGG